MELIDGGVVTVICCLVNAPDFALIVGRQDDRTSLRALPEGLCNV